ncbi:MAG: polysaccharide deacetylase family protein, partial [Methanomethylovorans sp.]|uniref:polysaccharide deacetylase family protein n=2 Tax=Methanomethylovorans sp. TaxID=2758717 RepID=UPI003C74820C
AYLWTIDGNIVSTKAGFSTSHIAVGTHSITFRVQDNAKKWSEPVTATLTITDPNIPVNPNRAPVLASIPAQTVTEGEMVRITLSATDDDGDVLTYATNATFGTLNDNVFTWLPGSGDAGTYHVNFSVTDGKELVSENAIITVTAANRAPVVTNFSISPNPATLGTTISFNGSGTDEDGSIIAYLWTLNDTNLSTSASFSISSIPVGNHTIKFKVQDNDGAWSDEVNSILNITKAPMQVPSGTSVILTFDDGWKSDYSFVYPLLKHRGIRSTHYIIASAVGTGSYMSWNDIKNMYEDGFDIQCHSNTHPSFLDSSINVTDELVKVNEAFEAHGLPTPRHTAYPYGEFDNDVIAIVSQYRDSGRVVSWYNDTPYHTEYPTASLKLPYELPSYPTDFHDTITQIDEAIAGNYTLILCIHAVNDIPGEYNMTTSEFTSIINYIELKQIPTQTISEYYDKTFAAPNVAPVSRIDMITPNPTTKGNFVYFKGNGTDKGGAIKSYLWTLDGKELSTEDSFITSTENLTIGKHTITFMVQDNDGIWSEAATSNLTVTEPEPSWEVPSGTSVILTFTGGRMSDYKTVYQTLKSTDICSTHYIIASFVGQDSTRMSWDEIKVMYDDGFDMECNSNTFSSFLDASTNVTDEMIKVNEAFEAHGLPVPKHTAYPYGDVGAVSTVQQYRDSARAVAWGQYSSSLGSLKSPYELPCYLTERGDSLTEIDNAIAGNYTLILGFGQVIENPGKYDTSVAEFVSIINYIRSNKIPTQTISEYYNGNF